MTVQEKIKLVGFLFRKEYRIRFAPKPDFSIDIGDMVVVEKNGTLNLAKVVRQTVVMDVSRWDSIAEKGGQCRVLRKANHDDFKYFDKISEKEKAAFKTCKEKIAKHNLPMHLFETIWDDHEKKYIFYFTAESRVDFRELLKDLVSTFNTKIQLWQVGARDAMKFFGGLGPCGYTLCCTTFLGDIESVELSFARMQNLPMNVAKLTGSCGRLVCCLRYELQKGEQLKIEELPIAGLSENHIPVIIDEDEEGT